ncbi:MAG: thioredoxin-dependent thiol peroxidase [Patescibacteria group bacterium]
MTSLTIGTLAPDFTLPDQNGASHTLSQYRGHWVVLYFYPKDMTPGCTTEACTFRDNFDALQKVNAVVLGVSTDSVSSHQRFANKHALPFPLLADVEKTVVKLYTVWGAKKFLGRELFGTKRVSFLIRPDGRIAKIYEQVKPQSHPDEVLYDIATV